MAQAHALLLVASAYTVQAPLRPPDAAALNQFEDSLSAQGFACVRVTDTGYEDTFNALQRFVDDVLPCDSVFVYVSGYGVVTAEDVYFVPTDYGRSPAPACPVRHAFPLCECLLKPLSERRSRVDVVVFDACMVSEGACDRDVAARALEAHVPLGAACVVNAWRPTADVVPVPVPVPMPVPAPSHNSLAVLGHLLSKPYSTVQHFTAAVCASVSFAPYAAAEHPEGTHAAAAPVWTTRVCKMLQRGGSDGVERDTSVYVTASTTVRTFK